MSYQLNPLLESKYLLEIVKRTLVGKGLYKIGKGLTRTGINNVGQRTGKVAGTIVGGGAGLATHIGTLASGNPGVKLASGATSSLGGFAGGTLGAMTGNGLGTIVGATGGALPLVPAGSIVGSKVGGGIGKIVDTGLKGLGSKVRLSRYSPDKQAEILRRLNNTSYGRAASRRVADRARDKFSWKQVLGLTD